MINTIVFDLGGVLIDWNPEYLYTKIFSDKKQREEFLTSVCDSDWNECQDAGRPLVEGTKILIEKHPNYANEIKAFYDRWDEMLGGEITGTVKILEAIYEQDQYPLYALTNWSHETFPIALERYSFLQLFKDIVVSGVEKTRKPHSDFYEILLNRHALDADRTLFIDDNKRNIEAANQLGFKTILFTSPENLNKELKDQYSISTI